MISILTFIISSLGLIFSIAFDCSIGQYVSGTFAGVSLVTMPLSTVVSTMSHNVGKAVGIMAGVGVALTLGFFAAVIVGAGQWRPPKMTNEAAVWTATSDKDSLSNQIVSGSLPKNSWWTDGDIYYQVVQTGNTMRLEGVSLHEGGFATALKLDGDAMRIVLPSDGYTSFAEEGCLVERRKLNAADASLPDMEVLVAYKAGSNREIVGVLQRFEDKPLTFALKSIHRLLEGTYQDPEGNTWTFQADGKVKTSDKAPAKAYETEMVWHTPTNIVRLPDGRRVGLEMSSSQLHLLETTYNKDEEWWEVAEPKKEIAVLQRTSAEDWYRHMIVTRAVGPFLKGSVTDIYSRYANACLTLGEPVALLNMEIMHLWTLESEE